MDDDDADNHPGAHGHAVAFEDGGYHRAAPGSLQSTGALTLPGGGSGRRAASTRGLFLRGPNRAPVTGADLRPAAPGETAELRVDGTFVK